MIESRIAFPKRYNSKRGRDYLARKEEEIKAAGEYKRKHKSTQDMHNMMVQLAQQGKSISEIKEILIESFPERAAELMNSAIEKNVDGTIKISRLDARINDIWNKFSPQSKANQIQRNYDDDGR